MSDEFAEDKVLVVLSNAESLKFKTYCPEDFSEINCLHVRDLTEYSTDLVKQKIANTQSYQEESLRNSANSLLDVQDVDINRFNRILAITLSVPGKEKVLEAIGMLEDRDDIIYVGPNYQASFHSAAPNDIYYEEQDDVAELISLPQAWNSVASGVTIRVGVVDTGIDQSHPDLTNRVNAALSRNFTDQTGPDYVATKDNSGHGTHVAGIIAAQTNNGVGIAGICTTVELISLKVAISNGGTEYEDIIEAIEYANSISIPILNISIGGIAEPIGLEEAIENYTGLVVCAAGNDGSNNDMYGHYPSNYRLDNLIAVGASYSSGGTENRCDFSNFGKTTVDIFAPGENIISCYPAELCRLGICEITNTGVHIAEGYHKLRGTSMATPFVTGIAALTLSKFPHLSASELKEKIMSSVDPVQSLGNCCVTGGRINAYLAVHGHQYIYHSTMSSGMHDCTCTICGHTTAQPHVWETVSVTMPLYRCTVCGYTASYITGLSVPKDDSLG